MLQVPDFHLRDWLKSDLNSFKQNAKRIDRKIKRIGQSSPHYREAIEKLTSAVRNGHANQIHKEIGSRYAVRAFADLYEANSDFFEEVQFDDRIIDALKRVDSKLGLVPLMKLISAFVGRYDKIGSQQELELLGTFIQTNLSLRAQSVSKGALRNLVTFRAQIFTPNAHTTVVNSALESGIQLQAIFEKFGVAGMPGRFHQICRHTFYLGQLGRIDVGEKHPVLDQLSEPGVYESLWEGGELLGHQVLRTLIDRTTNTSISDAWRDLILRIAGDPRVAKTSRNFQDWWAYLDFDQISKMKGWLSRFDLKLFLEALRQSAFESNNEDKIRMFKSRKVFMEGLLDQNLIEESRLFLGSEDERYLKRIYGRENRLPSYARISDSRQTSVIYLKVANFHMVEGSHSFRLKIMDEMPDGYDLGSYAKSVFRDYYLRQDISRKYCVQFPSRVRVNPPRFLEVVHGKNWEHKVVSFLKTHGVRVDFSKVVDGATYRAAIRTRGLP